jgi:hypothetical protein
MIATKPIFGIMKLAAKSVMKRASRKAGIDWDKHARQMQQTAEVGLAATSCSWLRKGLPAHSRFTYDAISQWPNLLPMT